MMYFWSSSQIAPPKAAWSSFSKTMLVYYWLGQINSALAIVANLHVHICTVHMYMSYTISQFVQCLFNFEYERCLLLVVLNKLTDCVTHVHMYGNETVLQKVFPRRKASTAVLSEKEGIYIQCVDMYSVQNLSMCSWEHVDLDGYNVCAHCPYSNIGTCTGRKSFISSCLFPLE